MKRILFYGLLLIQVGILSILGIQYYLIDDYGVTVKLLQEDITGPKYQAYDVGNDMYVDYEINTLPSDVWNMAESVDYNEKVYVLLEADENGVYHAVNASAEKFDAKSNQVVLTGKYQYYDSTNGEHRITYGIEQFSTNNSYTNLDSGKQWVISIKLAPWGQKKVIDVENVME
ncbi:GDYXXLXY domain-containing protein [Virgibacillus byunsanensis]|uniref:GDYXXLXY domain-containing protein n=1 Tax=Virgibacillus byunsanensis TaxID=570945 RepID=A0ABW3LKS2_9BACI